LQKSKLPENFAWKKVILNFHPEDWLYASLSLGKHLCFIKTQSDSTMVFEILMPAQLYSLC
jgi:hypothetical protein